jgi:hypothetical protein
MFKTPNTIYLTKPDVLRALGRDMLSVARYLCSCACLYDPHLWAQAEAEADSTTTRESTQHLATTTNVQPSYRTVDSVSPPTSDEETGDAYANKTDEVLHHRAPIEVATVTNPLHTAVTLPPAPVAIDIRGETPTGSDPDAPTLCSPVSSSSSDDEAGSARVRMAEVEDAAVGGDPDDPWHVL